MTTQTLAPVIITLLAVQTPLPAFAIDLYMDSKTQQIYGTPGQNRVFIGSFEKPASLPIHPPKPYPANGQMRQPQPFRLYLAISRLYRQQPTLKRPTRLMSA